MQLQLHSPVLQFLTKPPASHALKLGTSLIYEVLQNSIPCLHACSLFSSLSDPFIHSACQPFVPISAPTQLHLNDRLLSCFKLYFCSASSACATACYLSFHRQILHINQHKVCVREAHKECRIMRVQVLERLKTFTLSLFYVVPQTFSSYSA